MDNNESEQLQKAKTARTKRIGIILLIAIGIPLLLIGTCIFFLNNAAG